MPFTVVRAGWILVSLSLTPPAPAAAAPARVVDATAPRLVWLIFDELDGRVLWDASRRYDYPEFDALRSRGVTAMRVIPPGRSTLDAMPSLWIGARVESRALTPEQLAVRLPNGDQPADGSPELLLGELDHLFRRVHEAGRTIGISGFYHPYCRLFGAHAQRCTEFALATVCTRITRGWLDSVRANARAFLPTWRRWSAIDTLQRLRRDGLRNASDPGLDFVTVHLNVPHPPHLYDPDTETLSVWALERDYHANVLLADRLLGEFREAISAAGLSERTFLVVSSDHGSKGILDHGSEPGAVPLLIGAPGGSGALEVERPLAAVRSHALILEILAGRLATNPEIAAWLARPPPEPGGSHPGPTAGGRREPGSHQAAAKHSVNQLETIPSRDR